jgi:hypothetical protein
MTMTPPQGRNHPRRSQAQMAASRGAPGRKMPRVMAAAIIHGLYYIVRQRRMKSARLLTNQRDRLTRLPGVELGHGALVHLTRSAFQA